MRPTTLNYIFKFINFQTIGKITDLVHKININSFEKIASKFLNLNEIGYAKVALNKNTITGAALDVFDSEPKINKKFLI